MKQTRRQRSLRCRRVTCGTLLIEACRLARRNSPAALVPGFGPYAPIARRPRPGATCFEPVPCPVHDVRSGRRAGNLRTDAACAVSPFAGGMHRSCLRDHKTNTADPRANPVARSVEPGVQKVRGIPRRTILTSRPSWRECQPALSTARRAQWDHRQPLSGVLAGGRGGQGPTAPMDVSGGRPALRHQRNPGESLFVPAACPREKGHRPRTVPLFSPATARFNARRRAIRSLPASRGPGGSPLWPAPN